MSRKLSYALVGAFSLATSGFASAQVDSEIAPPTVAEQEMLVELRKQWKEFGLGDLTTEQEQDMLRQFRDAAGNARLTATMMRAAREQPAKESKPRSVGAPPAGIVASAAQLAVAPTELSVGQAGAESGARVEASASATDAARTWVYHAPSNNEFDVKNFGCGIVLEGFRDQLPDSLLKKGDGIAGDFVLEGDGKLLITTFRGGSDYQHGNWVNTATTSSVSKDGQACTLAITPGAATAVEERGIASKLWKQPDFGAEEVLRRAKMTIPYKISAISPYRVEALLGNFERLTRSDCPGRGVRAEKEGAKQYCLETEHGPMSALVECYAYREGSKCSATTRLTPQRQGQVSDGRPLAVAFARAFEKVLAD